MLAAAVIGIGVASSAEVGRAFVAFDRDEVGALDEAIAAMPEGARVAGLIFDRGSREVKFSPFIHSVAWVQAENGGAVMFTFADFPQSPFTFRDGHRPPRVPPRWEWMPRAGGPGSRPRLVRLRAGARAVPAASPPSTTRSSRCSRAARGPSGGESTTPDRTRSFTRALGLLASNAEHVKRTGG